MGVLTFMLLVAVALLYAAHRRGVARITALEDDVARLRERIDAEAEVRSQARVERVRAMAPPPEAMPLAAPPAAEERVAAEPVVDQASAPDQPKSEPKPEPEPVAEDANFVGLFERLVGGRLLVWIGGIALAIAGVFLVRYTVEIGLVTPPVRMLAAAAFGLVLIGVGEIFRSGGRWGADPRTAQALVGAGIFVLYAATYGSLTLYELIGVGTATLLMAAITGAALLLALRHGAPTAVMGMTGGFLTPLLIGDPESGAVPLLAYLAILNAGLFALAARREWSWLAAAAVVLSFVWSALLLISPAPGDALAAGVFIVALGIAASVARPGGGRELKLLQPAAIGLVQLALLVGRTDLGLAAWALFGILAAATMVLAGRRPEYRLLPAGALLLTLLLIGAKAASAFDPYLPLVAAVATALFGGFALPRAVRAGEEGHERLIWAGVAAAALAGPALVLRLGQPDFLPAPGWALLFALLAIGPAWLAWRLRDGGDRAVTIAAAGAALLLAAAAHDLVPRDLRPAAWLLVAMGAAVAARRLGSAGTAWLAHGVALLGGIAAALMVDDFWRSALASLVGEPALAGETTGIADATQLLALPGALLLLFARVAPPVEERLRSAVRQIAVLLLIIAAYLLIKQAFDLADVADFRARGFAERTLINQALFASGWLLASGRVPLPGIGAARLGAMLTGLAAARLVWFDLIVHNPALADQHVGSLPILNLLLPAFLGSAAWLYLARRRAGAGASGIWLALFLVALVAGTMLMVRQVFQGSLLSMPSMPLAEFYGYSLAGLVLSIGLLAAGVRLPDKALRLAGLALLTATIVKVFLVDAAELEGLLRILSFLGLGVALIGVGKLYAKVLALEARSRRG